MGRRHAEICKQGHGVSGENLKIKSVKKYINGKYYFGTEHCCKTCYARWREDYKRRKVYTHKPKGEIAMAEHQPKSYLRATL